MNRLNTVIGTLPQPARSDIRNRLRRLRDKDDYIAVGWLLVKQARKQAEPVDDEARLQRVATYLKANPDKA